MKSLIRKILVLKVSGLMLLIIFAFSEAQTLEESVNEINNQVLMTSGNCVSFDNFSIISHKDDSNVVVLESVSTISRGKSTFLNARTNKLNKLERTLIEEMETEMEMEDWMLKPFILKINAASYIETDEEENIKLEDWMIDLSQWQ